MKVKHTIGPIYDKDSKILILGTFPSVKSREINFYYANPHNRFWKTMERIFNTKIEDNIDAKKKFLHDKHIALFDVIKECDIESSSDTSIKNVIPNDFSKILKESKIEAIFTTGKKAYKLYNKYCKDVTGIEATYLPSTSPANCPHGIEDILYNEYSKILKYIN